MGRWEGREKGRQSDGNGSAPCGSAVWEQVLTVPGPHLPGGGAAVARIFRKLGFRSVGAAGANGKKRPAWGCEVPAKKLVIGKLSFSSDFKGCQQESIIGEGDLFWAQ